MSETSQPNESAQPKESAQSPDEIAAEIEATRARLAESVDALSDKLDVKAQAKEKVHGATADLKAKVRQTTADAKAKVQQTTAGAKAKLGGGGTDGASTTGARRSDVGTPVEGSAGVRSGAVGSAGVAATPASPTDRVVAGSRTLLDRFMRASRPVQAAIVAVPVGLLITVIVRRARA